MKALIPILIGLLVVGCGKKEQPTNTNQGNNTPEKLIANPIVEKAIGKAAKKPTGKLTKADLEKVTRLFLDSNQLTEVPKGLEKHAKLTFLNLKDNPALTKAQIAELQKALPNCKIDSNPTK